MQTSRCSMIALLGALVFAGCGPVYVRSRGTVRARATVRVAAPPTHVVVQSAPPPVRPAVTARPPSPTSGAVWVAGHYKWEGQTWVWIDGHWETGHPGEVWVAPVASNEGGRVVYRPGYWCPADQQPDPAYRTPGTVRVSVRPAQPTSGGTVVVREGGSTSGSSGTSGGRVTVRASGSASAGGSVRVRTGSGTTGTTTPTRPRATGGTVTVHGADVNRGDDSVATAAPTSSGVRVRTGSANPVGSTGTTRVVGGSANPVGSTGTTRVVGSANPVESRGSTTVTGSANPSTGTVTVRPGTAGTVTSPERQTPDGPEMRLTCGVNTRVAPPGGIITVTGTFSSNARVQIGGRYGVIRSRAAQQIRVQLPGGNAGGAVRVIDGDRTAACGTVTIR